MARFFRTSAKATAFILFTYLGASAATAQQPNPANTTPAYTENDSKNSKEVGSPAGPAPVAPSPTAVVDLAANAPAQVLPPAPKIVARSANAVVIPGSLTSGSKYTSRRAAWSDLKINSNFGYRRDPFSRRGRMHTGVDLKAAWGETVGAAMAGTVSFAGVKRGYGNIVVIEHGNNVSTWYAHLSSMVVEEGQSVVAGQVIGHIGSTGRSTSPHLHYEVRANGHPVNPLATLAFDGTQVFVDGRPLSGAVVEGWGDEPDAAAAPAGQAGPADAARPRRAAGQAAEGRMLVYGEDSLTEY
jgi:murein DD-endopeptidase MepM/ murein hydrolase activator NlpD